MRRLLRENALCLLAAAAASAAMAWLGLYGFAWNDYETEAKPAFDALIEGHVLAFLQLAPAYGGSLLERAPFALLPGVWGGGALAVYRMVALPCLAAAAILAVWLCAQMRSAGLPALSRALAVAVCVANPLTLRALEVGHPEELLGGSLCVAAVLLAARGRALWAGALLGLAIANKEWALLAVGPVLLALPSGPGRRAHLAALALAGAVAGAVLAPLALVPSGGFAAGTRALASAPSAIFQPWQIFWFAGHHGALVHGLFGAPKPGYRTGPAWALRISHPLILLAGALLAAALWLRYRRRAPGAAILSEGNALLALALVLLLRCLLDSWDAVYYPLPFIFALLAWEVRLPRPRGLPVLALASTVLAWVSFQWLGTHGASPDLQAAFFLAWTLALSAGLASVLFAVPLRSRMGLIGDGVMAGVMAGVLANAALGHAIWEDFMAESAPAVQRLMAGDVHGFLALAPAYGGSLVAGAPALALGGALGAINGAYRLYALLCVAAVAVLALALAAIQRSAGRPALSRWLLIALLVASPAASWAIKEGHPEELLAAALCVGGMLLLLRGRITTAAILLGLAVACKQWALLAVPLALVLAPGQRLRLALLAAGGALLLWLPLTIADWGHFLAANRGLASAPYIFHSEQLWWTLHLDYLRPLGGTRSTIFGPAPIALVARYSHPLILVVGVALALAWWARGRAVQRSDALLMLALVLLLRCILDPWNVIYYEFPFLLALASWEVVSERGAPLFTLAASFLLWSNFRVVNPYSSSNLTNLFFITWTLPAAAMMLWHSLRLPRPRFLVERGESTLAAQAR